jgi:hypothetical protein
MPAMDRKGAAPGAMPMGDDLPRTLRREREARERSGLGGAGLGGMAGMAQPAPAPIASGYVPEPGMSDGLVMSGSTVTDVRIPFFRLMVICIKLVLAAIPALLLLGGILWLAGHLLMTFFPWLVKLQILIRVP